MESQIKIKRTIIHSEHALMQSRTEGGLMLLYLADRNSDDTIILKLDDKEIKQLEMYIGWHKKEQLIEEAKTIIKTKP